MKTNSCRMDTCGAQGVPLYHVFLTVHGVKMLRTKSKEGGGRVCCDVSLGSNHKKSEYSLISDEGDATWGHEFQFPIGGGHMSKSSRASMRDNQYSERILVTVLEKSKALSRLSMSSSTHFTLGVATVPIPADVSHAITRSWFQILKSKPRKQLVVKGEVEVCARIVKTGWIESDRVSLGSTSSFNKRIRHLDIIGKNIGKRLKHTMKKSKSKSSTQLEINDRIALSNDDLTNQNMTKSKSTDSADRPADNRTQMMHMLQASYKSDPVIAISENSFQSKDFTVADIDSQIPTRLQLNQCPSEYCQRPPSLSASTCGFNVQVTTVEIPTILELNRPHNEHIHISLSTDAPRSELPSDSSAFSSTTFPMYDSSEGEQRCVQDLHSFNIIHDAVMRHIEFNNDELVSASQIKSQDLSGALLRDAVCDDRHDVARGVLPESGVLSLDSNIPDHSFDCVHSLNSVTLSADDRARHHDDDDGDDSATELTCHERRLDSSNNRSLSPGSDGDSDDTQRSGSEDSIRLTGNDAIDNFSTLGTISSMMQKNGQDDLASHTELSSSHADTVFPSELDGQKKIEDNDSQMETIVRTLDSNGSSAVPATINADYTGSRDARPIGNQLVNDLMTKSVGDDVGVSSVSTAILDFGDFTRIATAVHKSFDNFKLEERDIQMTKSMRQGSIVDLKFDGGSITKDLLDDDDIELILLGDIQVVDDDDDDDDDAAEAISDVMEPADNYEMEHGHMEIFESEVFSPHVGECLNGEGLQKDTLHGEMWHRQTSYSPYDQFEAIGRANAVNAWQNSNARLSDNSLLCLDGAKADVRGKDSKESDVVVPLNNAVRLASGDEKFDSLNMSWKQETVPMSMHAMLSSQRITLPDIVDDHPEQKHQDGSSSKDDYERVPEDLNSLSNNELHELVQIMTKTIKDKDAKICNLNQYIERLLTGILENNPSILHVRESISVEKIQSSKIRRFQLRNH